jgi:hypothetical protein
MGLAWQKSHQITSVDLEEFQNLLQGIPDFIANSFRGKGDEPRGQIRQEFFKLQALFGFRSLSRIYFILCIQSRHLCKGAENLAQHTINGGSCLR